MPKTLAFEFNKSANAQSYVLCRKSPQQTHSCETLKELNPNDSLSENSLKFNHTFTLAVAPDSQFFVLAKNTRGVKASNEIALTADTFTVMSEYFKSSLGVVQGTRFGTSVALSSNGNVLAVAQTDGAGPDSSLGGVLICKKVDGKWQHKSTIVSPASVTSFGRSIDLDSDGNTIAIGARGDAFVYAEQALDTWSMMGDYNVVTETVTDPL